MIINPPFKFTQKLKGFVVLEGLNGAGKSTLAKGLAKYISDHNRKVITSREPGGTPFGNELRDLINSDKYKKISPTTEMLLFAADRAEHVSSLVKPSTEKGIFVLLDRYFYSSVAFQGYGNQTDPKIVNDVNLVAVGNFLPDAVILIDLPPEVGFTRTTLRGGEEKDKFEAHDIEFHKRVRSGFLTLAEESSVPFLVLDGTKSEAELLSESKILIDALL